MHWLFINIYILYLSVYGINYVYFNYFVPIKYVYKFLEIKHFTSV